MSWKEQIDSPYDSWNYLGKDNMKAEYEYIDIDDMKTILLDQLRQTESRKFQHNIYQPSKLEDSNAYIVWQQQKQLLETQLKQLKKTMNELSISKEALLKLLEDSKA